MELTKFDLKPCSTPLTGFAGDTTITIGTIMLSVCVGQVTTMVNFLVVDEPAIYNIILGGPWLYAMRAIPSPMPEITRTRRSHHDQRKSTSHTNMLH
ncbi:unnamed protein product [Microthlaspi erraticum]|uniref:Uncharacterized protein n=1 Tax=Microthlaspi erraticum TaxID=1685480 RepID=A0A6D2IHC5_9BRAS|nr:unnamed protein product [Microthlaspi erraticum]